MSIKNINDTEYREIIKTIEKEIVELKQNLNGKEKYQIEIKNNESTYKKILITYRNLCNYYKKVLNVKNLDSFEKSACLFTILNQIKLIPTDMKKNAFLASDICLSLCKKPNERICGELVQLEEADYKKILKGEKYNLYDLNKELLMREIEETGNIPTLYPMTITLKSIYTITKYIGTEGKIKTITR